ncbi:hypothetical protein ACFSX5_01015 [Devosia albogilva]|uniref:Uncharacterized protein n=1 Tax=Devosia albogilva TaxID=429726 RepID=A0ABW5QFV3_9HYPH
MSTLRQMQEEGWRITLHCTASADRLCAHSWTPSFDQLIQYLGPDTDLVVDRSGLQRFRCERCGSRGVTVIVHPPDEIEHRAYGGHANGRQPLTYDQALAAEMERRRQMRLYGLKTNAEVAAESRERLKRERRAQKSDSGLIGPVSPYLKGRVPKR